MLLGKSFIVSTSLFMNSISCQCTLLFTSSLKKVFENFWELQYFSNCLKSVRVRGFAGRVVKWFRVRSLVVSDLRLETKGSRFKSGCWLCEEVGSGSEETRNALPRSLSPVIGECSWKKTQVEKKKNADQKNSKYGHFSHSE